MTKNEIVTILRAYSECDKTLDCNACLFQGEACVMKYDAPLDEAITLIESQAEEIEKLKDAYRWHSAEDEPPAKNGEYFVVQNTLFGTRAVQILFYASDSRLVDSSRPDHAPGWFGYSDWGITWHDNVLYWMPQPDIPHLV